MGKYAEMEKRAEELEALFDSEIAKLDGYSDLLAEHDKICERLYRRNVRNRIISNILYFCSALCFFVAFVAIEIDVLKIFAMEIAEVLKNHCRE